jgi:phage terminase large subunit-like protein
MEAGKVFFLRGAPGIEMLKAQLTAFPNGEHDDLVDAAVYGADPGGTDFYFTSANR